MRGHEAYESYDSGECQTYGGYQGAQYQRPLSQLLHIDSEGACDLIPCRQRVEVHRMLEEKNGAYQDHREDDHIRAPGRIGHASHDPQRYLPELLVVGEVLAGHDPGLEQVADDHTRQD